MLSTKYSVDKRSLPPLFSLKNHKKEGLSLSTFSTLELRPTRACLELDARLEGDGVPELGLEVHVLLVQVQYVL